ncbi:MAG: hypothetical protein IT427_09180 [Pirellulales bacterium]|nr:hypothetical protein [Pirellulales bacterium]
MATVVLKEPEVDLFFAWQEQIGRERGMRLRRGPRPFAALIVHYRGYAVDGFVELSRLRIDVLHDRQNPGGPVIHRFARYSAGLIADGVIFGGANRIQFEKNLSLTPGRKSYGRRIGAKDPNLLGAALEIDRYLERHSRFPNYPRRAMPRLPRCWVSLNTQHPRGSGPEFERFCRESETPTDLALAGVRYLHRDSWFYPLCFVLHHRQQIRAALVDLSSVPPRQVFRIERQEDLVGSEGACWFDFANSCYRSEKF